MIDFDAYNIDYEVPLNPANFVNYANFVGCSKNRFLCRSHCYFQQSDAYLECADELAKWYHANTKSANAFDAGVIIYLSNHSIELKLKAIMLKLEIEDMKGHNFIDLFNKISDNKVTNGYKFSDEIRELIVMMERYNTPHNELGRYFENNKALRLADDVNNSENMVFVQIMLSMYNYHKLHSFLTDLYDEIVVW